MSLGIVIKGPEGIVLAAESRVTLTAGQGIPNAPPIHVNFDNATKLLSFSGQNTAVSVVTYGLAAINLRTAHSYIPEFESQLPDQRLPIAEFSQRLSDFFMTQWQVHMPPTYTGPNMTFVVGGFNDGEPYGRVFQFDIPRAPQPVEQYSGVGEFGITWGGQREFVDRLIQGYDHRLPAIAQACLSLNPQQEQLLSTNLGQLQMNIPLLAMPLQDCVDLAMFFIRTTITAQRLTVGIRGCGGPIDVAIITRREGFRFIQKKDIAGELDACPRV